MEAARSAYAFLLQDNQKRIAIIAVIVAILLAMTFYFMQNGNFPGLNGGKRELSEREIEQRVQLLNELIKQSPSNVSIEEKGAVLDQVMRQSIVSEETQPAAAVSTDDKLKILEALSSQ